jgi:hypothetical protein
MWANWSSSCLAVNEGALALSLCDSLANTYRARGTFMNTGRSTDGSSLEDAPTPYSVLVLGPMREKLKKRK